MLHVLLYVHTAWANNHERCILLRTACYCTVHQKRVLLLRQGIPFFSMRTIPILIGWRLFRFFRHQPAKRTFMHLCMCGFHSYSSHMYRESHSRHVGSYSSKRKKKVIRCLTSREPPQRSAGLAAFWAPVRAGASLRWRPRLVA